MPRIYIRHLRVGDDAIDVHQHVNNQEFLRWMQEIAIEHSSAQGWPMERYLKSGASWYVRSHFIEYLRPALLGDDLQVCTWISDMQERSSPRQTLFLRVSDRRILARAETQWIFVNLKNGRPVAIPEALRTAFEIVKSEEEVLSELERLAQGSGAIVA
ncbi:MAG: acyl-CoA thioesterase [Betaproteobacteria bacterium]